MDVLVLLSMFSIITYTMAVCVKEWKIPYSISATFYKLEHPHWFGLTMWTTAGLLLPAALEVSSNYSQCFAFLACVGLIMVGSAPNFRKEQEGTIHDIGAILCVSCSQIWVAYNNPWALLSWAAYILYTIIYMCQSDATHIINKFLRSRPMFWVEIAALLSTYITVFKAL